MGKFIEKRNGVNIYEYEAPKYRGKENINGVIADGMVLRLYISSAISMRKAFSSSVMGSSGAKVLMLSRRCSM